MRMISALKPYILCVFKISAIQTRAEEEAKAMTVFDFAKFELKLFRKSSDKNNVQYHFNLVIHKNIKNGKIGTAESYKYTLNSLAGFSKEENKCSIDRLTFDAITVDWLNDYQKFMIVEVRINQDEDILIKK